MKKVIFTILFVLFYSNLYAIDINAGKVINSIIKENSTIAGDSEFYNNLVYGASLTADGDCTLHNNILDNSGGTDLTVNDGVTVTGGYNVFDDASVTTVGSGSYTGDSNDLYSTDCTFMNPASNNFRLQRGSPCINVGKDLYDEGVTEDIEGNPRPN